MMKNKQKHDILNKDKPVEKEKTENYIGAEWIGADLFSNEFGKLEKGKIYPLSEQRAINSDGFKAVYKN